MIIVGDIHGKVNSFLSLVGEREAIQIGDFGFGFGGELRPKKIDLSLNLPSNVKFIRGNHDDPDICRQHPNYLGEFGIYQDMFFVSGAYSIDKQWRIEDESWWREEELTSVQMNECYDLYVANRPKIVISHDCPEFLISTLSGSSHKHYDTSATSKLLQNMFEVHQPKLWIFGHWHLTARLNKATEFICLNELDTYDTDSGIIKPYKRGLKLSKDWEGIL